ncbi:DUF6056 family protein [Butyrivibrio sp. TB]|uniref:DUF6056 family protein n=1 Tax=Butyrivibrio sp. TB TaxID=1520809 RepID=UPI0008B2FED2|nr:DUF6056 family protein [Butyrivibrio sp. TB]SEQ36765.1 hypothetical protein SAMN02910382_02792 [Butyrivibrio sp. TB]
MNKFKIQKKSILLVLVVLWALSIVPIIYCAMFDYATGDDFGKSANVHRLVVQGAPFWRIIAQAATDAVETWKGFEGTWASNFVLAMQPGIWGEKWYSLTPFIGLTFLFVGTGFFIYEMIVKRIKGYSKTDFGLIYLPLMILMSQYMPYIRGGLFWFTGMAHYTIPFGTALILLALNSRYSYDENKKLIPVMVVISGYIGGSHYQAILLALILQLLLLFSLFVKKNTKVIPTIIFEIVVELIGLFICAKAPGNSVRAGDEFGFSIGKAFVTVLRSIALSIQDGISYIRTIQLIPVYILAVISFSIVRGKHKDKHIIPKYLFLIAFSFLTYCAVYAPGVYYMTYSPELAISGGFFDFNYFCFLIFVTISAVLIGEIIGVLLKEKIAKILVIMMATIATMLLIVFGKSIIKNSHDYMIYNFIKDGRLEDFEAQMQERLEILLDDTQQNVVLPEMNDDQGPFMHMPLTSDISNFTNDSTRKYYGKESVIAIPRDEYNERFGN